MNTGATATLRVLASPFTWEGSERIAVDAGQTLDELFSKISPAYQSGNDYAGVYLAMNGEPVAASAWSSTIIPVDAELVLAPAPQGLDPVTWLYILYAVFVVAAIYYASTIQPPDVNQQQTPDASPTYSLNAQGNSARIGAPIPARYGRFRIYPDFAAIPFREYINGDQFLYQLFSIGQGSYSYTDLKIGDTPIGNFSDVEYVFYEPGQDVTLFPADVYTAPEVSGNGITLFAPNDSSYVGISGPFNANPAGTTTKKISVDVILPRGLSYANDEGGLDAASVAALFQYRQINDAGTAIGSWTTLANPTYTLSTVDPQRFTLSATVTQGRYEVRAQRTNNTSDDYRLNDEIDWTGLRTYLDGTQVFQHSTLAVKMRATNQLSAQAERKFNVVATRKLPIWTGSAWSALTATRNPAWAFCDAIKAAYGGRYSDAHLDLTAIKAIADVWAARNDYFDGQFDTATTLWPALQQICAVGRAVPYQYGEIFSIIRDSGSPPATYMFNGRNIERDSMTVTYQTMDVWADDSVEIEYVDPTSWKPETIICAIPGVTATNPRKVKLFGCTDRTQANREGMFLAAKMAFRSIVAEFTTELDGRVPQYLDRLIVAQEIYEWGQGGEVIGVAGQVLTLSEPVTFGSGSHYIWLRDDRGAVSAGPLAVAGSGTTNTVTVTGTLPTIYTGYNKERTYFAFARGSVTPRQMLLDKVDSAEGLKVKLRAVLDDSRAHQYDALVNAGTITTPTPAPPANPDDLTIYQLRIVRGGTTTEPALTLSWVRVPAASSYFVEVSYDAGASWARVYDGSEPEASFVVRPGSVVVRVAAFADVRGPWNQTTITAGAGFDVPVTPGGLALTGGAFAGRSLGLQWTANITALKYRVDYRDLSSVVRWSQTVATNSTTLDVATARLNGLGREFDVLLYGVNANGVASSTPAVLRVKNNQAAAVTGLTATGLLDRILLEWTPNSDTDIAGYRIYASTTSGFTPGPSNLVDANNPLSMYALGITPGSTWYLRVAAFDVWGESDELNFAAQVSAVGEYITTTKIADDSISTPKLAANSVTAAKISVSSLSAINANLGAVTSGTWTMDSAGWLRAGTTGYKTGNGLWFGYDSGQYKFSLGHSSSPGVDWDGSVFTIRGAGGAAVFQSGVGLQWSSVTGTGKPADNATVGANASNLAVGIAGNMVRNSDLSAGVQDWEITWVAGGGTVGVNYTPVTWDLAGVDWKPAGGHTVGINRSGTTLAASNWFDITDIQRISVEPSTRYELSAYLAAHRCPVYLGINYYKLVSGVETYISEDTNFGPYTINGGQSLSGWARAGGFITTPSDCTFVRLKVRAGAATAADPYHWGTRFFFGRALAGQTDLSPWSDGGSVNLSGLGYSGDLNATNGATFGVNIGGTFVPSTWIAAASITRAMIGALNVGTADILDLNVTLAKIADANVSTLKLQGNSVTVPVAAAVSGTLSAGVSIGNTDTVARPVIIEYHGDFTMNSGVSTPYVALTLYKDGSPIRNFYSSGVVAGAGSVGYKGTAITVFDDTLNGGQTSTYSVAATSSGASYTAGVANISATTFFR